MIHTLSKDSRGALLMQARLRTSLLDPILIPCIRTPLFRRATMSSFTLPNSSPSCTVKLVPSLSQEQLLSFPAFKTWISTLQHSLSQQQIKDHTFHTSPYKLRSIDIQAVDFFGGGRIGFVKLKTDVSNDKGEKLPGSVFLRGGSVGMLVSTEIKVTVCG